MPEITIYTNDGDCANGVAEINPFTVGDATDDWTLKFNDGNDFYSPSNVTMRVGHTNGLPDGTYNNAFKWVDRIGAESLASINLANGVPTLTFDTDPVGGVIGTDGVYILRGPQLDGAITSIEVLDKGYGMRPNAYFNLDIDFTRSGYAGYESVGIGTLKFPIFNNTPLGDSYASAYGVPTVIGSSGISEMTSVVLTNGGSGFPYAPIVTLDTFSVLTPTYETGDFNDYKIPVFKAIGNWPKYEFPFMRDESNNNIIAGTTLSPYSDGAISDVAQYDHSTLVIRPETVATASLISSGLNWIGTMDPINNYVNSRLSLRNSTQLDLQIRGDDRTLFQGKLTILNKIN